MKVKYTEKQLHSFIRESNAIEGVYDEASFQQALFAWGYLIKEKEMSPHVILKTHKILMLNQPNLHPNEKGYFRTIPVYVGGREGSPVEKISDEIKQWCINVNDVVRNGQNENLSFLDKLITDQHVKYEKIHPFVDGNGRTGRMFLNWTRMKLKYMPSLTIFKEADRLEYYKLFKE